MKSTRFKGIMVLVLVLVMMFTGCQSSKKQRAAGTHIYYVNTAGTALEKSGYEIKEDTVKSGVESILTALQNDPDSSDYISVFPQGIRIESWELLEEGVEVHFNKAYGKLDKASQVLIRAAVVQSVTQIKEVKYVEFFVKDTPVTDRQGNPLGYLSAEDFVKNVGSSLHTYQAAKLQLYFVSKKGDKLVKEDVRLRYNSNMSVEKLVVEQLIKGPSSQGYQPTISPDTKVLGVSIKDGICYINFDNGFLNAAYSIDPRLAIYSIVNSIVDAGNAGQVQISVNGETNVKFQDSIDLSKPLSRDLDIVEDVKK